MVSFMAQLATYDLVLVYSPASLALIMRIVDRIDSQVLCNHVQLGVHTTGEGPAVDANHAARRFVGVDPITVVPHMLHFVRLLHAQERHAGGNGSCGAVCAAIHIAGDVTGDDQAVTVRPLS